MRRRMLVFGMALVAIAGGILVWTVRAGEGPNAPEPGTASRSPRVDPDAGPVLEGRPSKAAPRTPRGEEPPDGVATESTEWSIVEGQLVGPRGQPLIGIPVYLAFADPKDRVRPDQYVLFAAGPDSDGGRAEAQRYGKYAITGPTGAFRLDAGFTRLLSSFDGRVRVVPSHPAWVEPLRASGDEGGVIRAEPAVSLAVRVVDDVGTPIPEFRAVVREPARHGDHGIVATNGGFVVQWRRREDLPAEVSASLVVWAPGRRIERRRVTIPADRDSDSITIDLGPVEPDGRLVLRPVPAPDAIRECSVILSLSFPERPDDEIRRVKATWEASERGGAFVALLPPGRFRARSYAWDARTEGPVSDDTIEVAPRETVVQTWETSSWAKTRARR